MQNSELRELAEGLIAVTLRVGAVQLAHRRAGVTAEHKVDESPVTIADRESEELILAALDELAPGVPVVAEESVAANRIPTLQDAFFLVDPLDGTKGYVRGGDEFTVNIALIVGTVPVFGLIYAPALSDYYVTTGRDAVVAGTIPVTARGRTLDELPLAAIHTRAPDLRAMKALTSQSHLNGPTRDFLARYNILERKAVSSSLKFGLVARGLWDVYARVGPTSEWDTAAGHAILKAAGGCVTKIDGAPLVYGNRAAKFINPDFVAWGGAPVEPQRSA